jgi:hypothetical protein
MTQIWGTGECSVSCHVTDDRIVWCDLEVIHICQDGGASKGCPLLDGRESITAHGPKQRFNEHQIGLSALNYPIWVTVIRGRIDHEMNATTGGNASGCPGRGHGSLDLRLRDERIRDEIVPQLVDGGVDGLERGLDATGAKFKSLVQFGLCVTEGFAGFPEFVSEGSIAWLRLPLAQGVVVGPIELGDFLPDRWD